jgi:hypothetical protein
MRSTTSTIIRVSRQRGVLLREAVHPPETLCRGPLQPTRLPREPEITLVQRRLVHRPRPAAPVVPVVRAAKVVEETAEAQEAVAARTVAAAGERAPTASARILELSGSCFRTKLSSQSR